MKLPLALVAVTLALLIAASPAAANVYVAKGQTVQEIRVVGQDVTVEGSAAGPVFVIGGDLTVGPDGDVSNVTVIGGRLRAAPGARLHGDVFQFGGSLPDLNGWALIAVILAALALRTAFACSIVVCGLRLARSRHARSLSAALATRPGRTITAGVLASSGLLALSVVALVTVVGMPVALMLSGLLLLALPVGIATLSQLIEEMRASRALLVAAAIPLLGDALLALSLAVGAGVLLRVVTQPKPEIAALPAAR